MMEINQENRFEWIDKYLENELSEEELSFFYKTLENDESLQADLQTQQEMHEQFLANGRMKVYANGQQTIIEDKNAYSKEEYANFSLIQGILKDKEKEDRPDFDAQKPNFFKKNFRVLMTIAALVVIVPIMWWLIQGKVETPIGDKPIVEEDTTKKENNSNKEVLPNIPDDNSEEIVKEEKPNEEIVQEEKPQIVEEDTRPKQFKIPEYTLSSRLGFAGKGQPNAKQRTILIHTKSPSDDIKDLSKVHYFFDDTLRFYGKNINAQELQLLYLQNDAEYLLVQKTDTLEIFKYPKWSLLRR